MVTTNEHYQNSFSSADNIQISTNSGGTDDNGDIENDAAVNGEWLKNKVCPRCELPFRIKVDDHKYRWCLECRQKKRLKNKRERTAKKRKVDNLCNNPSFAQDIPTETHFKKYNSFDMFLDYISHDRQHGQQTDAIFQSVLTEFQVSRFPEHFNFVNIGAKTVVKNRAFLTQVSDDDDEIMQLHIKRFQITSLVPSYSSIKICNLITTPILSLTGIYLEKRVGLIIVNQPESNSFVIQNSQKFLHMILSKLYLSDYSLIFKLNNIKLSTLQEEITKLFEEYDIDQYDALQAYKFFKHKRFAMLRELPQLLSQFTLMPKLKDLNQLKLLRQKIDGQLIKYADKISSETGYQFARKRRDVSQNGNFVINHYCRQDSHYRKMPTLENRKTMDCKSKLALFYNSITGDFKIIYSHREHARAPLAEQQVQTQTQVVSLPPQQLQVVNPVTVVPGPTMTEYIDVDDPNIDINLIAEAHDLLQLQQLSKTSEDPTSTENPDLDPANPEWRNYSNPLNFNAGPVN